MRPTVKNIKRITVAWNERQRHLRAQGLQARVIKELRGPFTNEDEVDAYFATNASDDEKQSRMKKEVQYARDTCISFPRTHPVFKIMNTSRPRRLTLTAVEFGEKLKLYLCKRTGRTDITVDDCRTAVGKM